MFCSQVVSKVFVILITLNLTVISIEHIHYLGDTSLRSYLKTLCASLSDHSKVKLVLVVDGNRSLADSLLAGHLRQLSCGHWHRFDQNGTFSNPEPWMDNRWFYTDWLLLFEWSHLTTQSTLTGPMLAISHLYARCERCLPPILLLDQTRWSVGKLFRWSRQILPRVDLNFRGVLVAGLDRVNAALHIRPVLDGCYILHKA